jgi:hypothetical protein
VLAAAIKHIKASARPTVGPTRLIGSLLKPEATLRLLALSVRQGTVIIIPGRTAEQDCLRRLRSVGEIPAGHNIGFGGTEPLAIFVQFASLR